MEVAVELGEEALVLAPLGLVAHAEVEEDLAAEELLEIEPRRGADGLDLLPSLADQDPAVAVALDQNRCREPQRAPLARVLPALRAAPRW